MADEKLLTSSEVARRLGVDRRTVARWVREGILVPAVRTAGGQHRYRWSEVEEQLRQRREDQPE